MPVLKKKPKAKEEAAEFEFEIDTVVQFDNDGETVVGTVTAHNDNGTYEITDSDENAYDVEASDVSEYVKKKAAKPESKAKGAKVGKAKGKGKGSSLADAFNSAKKATKGGGIPDGKWEALLTGASLRDSDKDSAKFVDLEYTAVNTEDEDVEGRKGRASYMILDGDGDAATGMEYFKRDMEMLGQPEEFDDDEALEAALDELAEQEPWCSINVKTNAKGYSTIYLNGLMEDQEDKPEAPAF